MIYVYISNLSEYFINQQKQSRTVSSEPTGKEIPWVLSLYRSGGLLYPFSFSNINMNISFNRKYSFIFRHKMKKKSATKWKKKYFTG